ncbi:phosphotransferase [Agromyces atrinae]|uniref:class III lanthionine synthetase LanKC N-terminal domain-containing protein n=1 Tax=Agromyces atrinae TaxID=592376 RepID=UPI001F56E195|nr:phosphotransferase [Agromyces atrinae]MCI2957334.1 phosphotransferase [Agromyces atrinae]
MPEDLDLFCLADPIHFAHPADWSPPWNVDLTRPKVRAGWSIELTSFWVVHRPPVSELVGRPLAGWKIHLSAVEETAIDMLDKVGEICVRERIVFKHLRSTALLVAMNSKGAPRTGSGKFVTIYPRDEAHSVQLADELSSVLDGVAGPRVLTDVAWVENAPVFVRHGAFASRTMWLDDGRRVHAVVQPDGSLAPDLRLIPHGAPGVDMPDAIRSRFDRRPVAFPFRVSAAIQFSNCGGVYRAEMLGDGDSDRPLVLKEARPHTGSGPSLVPATERLANEVIWLRRLAPVDGIPLLRGDVTVDGHRFIAVDEVPGVSLRHWVAANHPSLHPGASVQELDDFAIRCDTIMRGLRALVGRMHAEGVAHRDLHPGNVIVDDLLAVSIIDFELAAIVSDETAPTLGCPGFIIDTGTGAERDLHALDVIGLWLLSPVIGGAIEFDIRLLDRHLDDVASTFGRRAGRALAEAPAVRSRVRRRGPASSRDPHDTHDGPLSAQLADWLSGAAHAEGGALFPLDPRGMSSPLSELGLAHGASGAFTALHASSDGEAIRHVGAELRRRALGVRDDDPGLWEGWAGVGVAASLRGDHDLAAFAEQRAVIASRSCTSLDLASGLAGVASMLLALADADPVRAHRQRDDAIAIALRIGIGLDGPAAPTAPGIEDGYAGIALVLARAAAHADPADRRALERAVRTCRERDLLLCDDVRPGVLVARRGALLLPYLGRGALGIALARARTAPLVGESSVDEPVRALATSALIDIVVDAGPVAGRSGLAIALAALSGIALQHEATDRADTWSRWADRHLSRLDRNLVRTRCGTAALGRGGVRLSADLATGTAGVLCVTHALEDPTPHADIRSRLVDALVGGALLDFDPRATPGRHPRTDASAPDERVSDRDARPPIPERR